MKRKYLRRIGGLILAALLLPGLFITFSPKAQAQSQGRQRRVVIVRRYPRWYWDPFWDFDRYDRFDRYNRYSYYVFSNSEKAFNRGYKDGFKTGEGDAKNRRSYDPERSHYFQEAGFGNFAEAYRQGFARGYADAFRS